MDKLTIISGCLFLAADIFAIASIANPDWINTGESAGERRAPGGCGLSYPRHGDVCGGMSCTKCMEPWGEGDVHGGHRVMEMCREQW